MEMSSDALATLHCSQCDNYLTNFPVYTYNEDNSAICGNCPVIFDQNPTRQIVFENVAAHMKFPCRYQPCGCIQSLTPEQLNKHELTCEFRNYFCPHIPLGCAWQGYGWELINHYIDTHPTSFMKDICEVEVDLLAKFERNLILETMNESFLVQIKYDLIDEVKEFFCAVKYFGTSLSPEYYVYEILINDGDANESIPVDKFESIYISTNTHSNLSNLFADKSGSINLKVRVFKKVALKTNANKKNGSDLLKQLDCPVCFEIMAPPIHQCVAGHSLCSLCKRQMTRCPICTGPIKDTRNYTLETLTTLIPYTCKNDECSETFLISEKKTHEAVCKFGPIPCPGDGCKWKSSKCLLLEHILENHIFYQTDSNFVYTEDEPLEDIIIVANTIFSLKHKNDNDFFYLTVEFNADSKLDAFIYIFDINGITIDISERLYIQRKCVNVNEISQAEDQLKAYMKISLDLLQPFLIQSSFTYKIKISKS